MTVSFHGFLIVTIFSPFALAANNQFCGNKTHSPWELCCDDRVYRRADIWALESCNVEPKNATLNFADSAWLVYDCNIRQRLNSTSLTLESYFNLLFRPYNTSQNLLWKTLTFPDDIPRKILGENEHDKIQWIKLYHRECVQAVKQVCTFGDVTSMFKGFNQTTPSFYTRFSTIQFFRECNEEMLPYSPNFPGFQDADLSFEEFNKCVPELNHTLGNVNDPYFQRTIFSLCSYIEFQHLDIKSMQAQIVKPTLDFEGMISNFVPRFWSKWFKSSFKNLVLEELKKEFKAQDLQNLESLMRNKVEELANQNLSGGKYGDSLTHKRELVQAMIIIQIRDVFRKTARTVCRKDAHKNEKHEVL